MPTCGRNVQDPRRSRLHQSKLGCDKATHAYHALCRARVLEEIRRRKGTPSEDHLYIMAGLFVIGFICNLLIKAVDDVETIHMEANSALATAAKARPGSGRRNGAPEFAYGRT